MRDGIGPSAIGWPPDSLRASAPQRATPARQGCTGGRGGRAAQPGSWSRLPCPKVLSTTTREVSLPELGAVLLPEAESEEEPELELQAAKVAAPAASAIPRNPRRVTFWLIRNEDELLIKSSLTYGV